MLCRNKKLPVKVLILPKFELDQLYGDRAGEAQHYFEAYLKNSEEYTVADKKLYYQDGVALCVCGMGKVNAAITLMAILGDSRFDFTNSYVFSTGCCGASYQRGVMGDVYLITSCVDFDLGHHLDSKEYLDKTGSTWIHDSSYSDAYCKILNSQLCSRLYSKVKDIKLATTKKTTEYMAQSFDNADWALRQPEVLCATTVSGDNYWKGLQGHINAETIVQTYQCPHPFYSSEMEDIALATVMDRMGMLDRFISIRGAVNMDVFMKGVSPESLWTKNAQQSLTSDDSVESCDIFPVVMENIFSVGSVIIDAILNDKI